MKDFFETTVLVASIAVVVAIMFMAPKGFDMRGSNPIVSSIDPQSLPN